MPEKVMVLSVRRRRRDGTPWAERTLVPPAEQMRVTFDPHGQPVGPRYQAGAIDQTGLRRTCSDRGTIAPSRPRGWKWTAAASDG